MPKRSWTISSGWIAAIAGLMALAIYLTMILFTLPHIEAITGLRPFDMRPLGYSPADAATLLEALGPEGRAYYLGQQIPLDMLYPGLLAVTLVATGRWFGQKMPGSGLQRWGAAFAVVAALCDYAENLGIIAMVTTSPQVPATLIYASSTATVAKSALTTLAVMAVVVSGTRWVLRTRLARP